MHDPASVVTLFDEAEEAAMEEDVAAMKEEFMAKPHWHRAALVLEKFLDDKGFYDEVTIDCSGSECKVRASVEIAENATIKQEATFHSGMTEQELMGILRNTYKVPYFEAEAAFTEGISEAFWNYMRIQDAKIARKEGWVVAYAEFTADLVTAPTAYPSVYGWITGEHWRTGTELEWWEQVLGVFDVIPGEALAKAGITALVIKIGDKVFDFTKVATATRNFLVGARQAGLKVVMKGTNEVILYGSQGVKQIGRFANGVLQDIYWVYGGEKVLAKLANVQYIVDNRTVRGALNIVEEQGTTGLRLADQGEEFAALSAKRLLPGSATGTGSEITGTWLRGTFGSVGYFPKLIAEKLRGQAFKDFNEFRQAFWKAVADDPVLSKQFTSDNYYRMKAGAAPLAEPEQWVGKAKKYSLHHITPINQGGAVYDMDNIYIVTPRYHKDILDPKYHYGYGYD